MSRHRLSFVGLGASIISLSVLLSGCRNEVCQCKVADGTVASWKAKNCNAEWDTRKCIAPHYSLNETGEKVIRHTLLQLHFSTNIRFLNRSNKNVTLVANGLAKNQTKTLDCVHECDNPDSPWCQYIPDVAGSAINASIDKFASRLHNSSGRIAKEDVMADFNVANDPCGRLDTLIRDGTIQNEGGICSFFAEVKIGSTSAFVALVQLPQKLSATFSRQGTRDLEFDFSATSAELPNLILSRYWNADYGGDIRKINYINQSLILSTERGCLKID